MPIIMAIISYKSRIRLFNSYTSDIVVRIKIYSTLLFDLGPINNEKKKIVGTDNKLGKVSAI